MYLRALVPEACRWLRQARPPAELAPYEAEVAGPCPFRAPALESLLERLGALPDARHCQQASARFIAHEWGGDYLFGLKGNQSGIEEKAQHLLTQQGFPPLRANGKRATDGLIGGVSPGSPSPRRTSACAAAGR